MTEKTKNFDHVTRQYSPVGPEECAVFLIKYYSNQFDQDLISLEEAADYFKDLRDYLNDDMDLDQIEKKYGCYNEKLTLEEENHLFETADFGFEYKGHTVLSSLIESAFCQQNVYAQNLGKVLKGLHLIYDRYEQAIDKERGGGTSQMVSAGILDALNMKDPHIRAWVKRMSVSKKSPEIHINDFLLAKLPSVIYVTEVLGRHDYTMERESAEPLNPRICPKGLSERSLGEIFSSIVSYCHDVTPEYLSGIKHSAPGCILPHFPYSLIKTGFPDKIQYFDLRPQCHALPHEGDEKGPDNKGIFFNPRVVQKGHPGLPIEESGRQKAQGSDCPLFDYAGITGFGRTS